MFIENLSMPHYISYKVWEELNLQAIYNLQVMNTKAIGAWLDRKGAINENKVVQQQCQTTGVFSHGHPALDTLGNLNYDK
jgi:hypothetical protein